MHVRLQRLLAADDLAGCGADSSRAGLHWNHFSAGIVAKVAAIKVWQDGLSGKLVLEELVLGP